MCGIAGVWGISDEDQVRTMMGRLAHRGPDASGTIAEPGDAGVLGHRRLAIVDVAGGSQPIRDASGHRAIVANGEIYNLPTLRSRLAAGYRFQTRSDSEAALAAYDDRGTACPSELDGMFAFAIADGEHLFVARDPIGIKPLYVGRRGDNLLLASEIKALVGLADEVEEFPPGSWYHSEVGTGSYYDVPRHAAVERSVDRHVALVREALDRSVTKRLMSDVPVGAFLSGGLDSSAIVALMRPHVDELHTFSVGVDRSSDLEAARTVARHLDTVHHEYVLTPEDIAAHLPHILYHLESFDQDLVRSAVPTYFTARLASSQVKVILTGEGADELFAGYSYYRDYDDPALFGRELRRSVQSLHNINLQRVDRMTMAHSIEGRVPFLDVEMVDLAQTIPAGLKLHRSDGRTAIEKWVLRKACEDLLPGSVVWREKEQFDEGSGTVALLSGLVDRWMPGAEAREYAELHRESRLRSAEECLYHKILCDAYSDPSPVLENVARWTDRLVAA